MARNFISEIKSKVNSNIHVKDPEGVNKKIHDIIRAGFNNLQVVSDFDATITKQHENGKKHMSSFMMFSHCPSVTEEYVKAADAITLKYKPIEFDPSIPHEEKRRYMEEWWSKSAEAISGLSVSREEIDQVVTNLGNSLRDNSDKLFQDLAENNVPVLVFSAGLGDLVVAVLKHFKVLFDNVKVVSNFFNYGDDNKILGFKGTLIHVMNKNEYALKDSEYYNLIKERNNVILLGDSLGDASMADGMSHADQVLKIGFLYEGVEGNLPAYLDTFDIVLEDDQTMNVVISIIDYIKEALTVE